MLKSGYFLIPFIMTAFMLTGDSLQVDGPYVFYKGELLFIKSIVASNGSTVVVEDSASITNKKNISLQVNTDQKEKKFTVSLKENLENETATFKMPSKQLILSDIEGDFRAFSKILIANGVMDQDFNWTFDNGHLVLIGDFVDRGEMVTEVHWLIYSLEDKARAAGGYVHYILGNHEIMNLSGDLRYLNEKYVASASLLNLKYETIYGEQAELGKWLRTKNIIEKIGDNLFMHAGMSAEMNQLDISIKQINQLARPFYADSMYSYPDKKTPVIFSDFGPFWFRGFYGPEKSLMNDLVKNTLDQYRVKHIFTGHTIVADTISVWYDGRVINTDVHHAQGKSEAVLIEGKKYYRVNAKGEKFPLKVN